MPTEGGVNKLDMQVHMLLGRNGRKIPGSTGNQSYSSEWGIIQGTSSDFRVEKKMRWKWKQNRIRNVVYNLPTTVSK